MPDADTTTHSTGNGSSSQPPHFTDKDRVGEELADDARIWRVYDKIARADDKERVDTWNRGLDNLALFAALFSAVTTAFIIEAQQDLKVDYAQLTFLVLNATASGGPFVPEPFVVSSTARTITCLWVSSLVLSLSAALIAIMGKDWIGMYTARPVCNARQWAEMRTYRLHCVERWYMPGVIASAPVLLHVSLLFFGAGLVLFLSSDPFTHRLALGLALAAGALYFVTALSAIVFPASPFKSPATLMIRGAAAALLRSVRDILIYWPKHNIITTLHRAVHGILAPDLSEISRRQLRVLRAQGIRIIWDRNLLHQPEVLRLSPYQLARMVVDGASALAHAGTTLMRRAWSTLCTQVRKLYRAMRATASATASGKLAVGRIDFAFPWSDIYSYRSVEHLSMALSWLNTASEAPETLHALIVALGDLEIGAYVAPLVSSDLRRRVRAEIQFNWQKVDFLQLCRYVLADRNLSEEPFLQYEQFIGRFDMRKDSFLRCEDGLAAVVKIDENYITAGDVRLYCPDKLGQPRMVEMLLPHIARSHRAYQAIISFASCYKQCFLDAPFPQLEAALLQALTRDARHKFRSTAKATYGGRAGLVELLTHLTVEQLLYGDAAIAAIEMIVHLVNLYPEEHPCLPYLFGSDDLAEAAWDRGWTTDQLAWLSVSLPLLPYRYYNWDELDTPPAAEHYRTFELALARTAVKVWAPERDTYAHVSRDFIHNGQTVYMSCRQLSVCLVHVQLCHANSLLGPDDKLGLVQLLLETSALVWVSYPGYNRNPNLEQSINRPECSLEIVAAVCRSIARLLAEGVNSFDHAARLFRLLARSEITTNQGLPVIWDLGDFLREEAVLMSQEPSVADALRGLLSELKNIYLHCQTHMKRLDTWDSIGLPGAVERWSFASDAALATFFTADRVHDGDGHANPESVKKRGVGNEEHDNMWWLHAGMR